MNILLKILSLLSFIVSFGFALFFFFADKIDSGIVLVCFAFLVLLINVVIWGKIENGND